MYIMNNAKPIGGWLVFLVIQLLISIFWGISEIDTDIIREFNFDEVLANNSLDLANQIYFIVYFSFGITLLKIGIIVYLTILFFMKSIDFPKAFIYLGVCLILIVFTEESMTIMIGEIVYFRYTVIAILWVVAWGTYLLVSLRSKETFSNRKRKYVKISEEDYEEYKRNIIKEKNYDNWLK